MSYPNSNAYQRGIQQASAEQVGEAAALRFEGGLSSEDRETLNQIIHSADKDPHSRGHNPYADPSRSYDPNAQTAIDAIAARQKK